MIFGNRKQKKLDMDHSKESMNEAFKITDKRNHELFGKLMSLKKGTSSASECMEKIWLDNSLTEEETMFLIFKVGAIYGSGNEGAELASFSASVALSYFLGSVRKRGLEKALEDIGKKIKPRFNEERYEKMLNAVSDPKCGDEV